jgi:hypothetical protein
MDNFFVTYLDWIIEQYNDGENIIDILNSGYTANTGTYYCPECSPYILTSGQVFFNYGDAVGFQTFSECCLNFTSNNNKYLLLTESSGGTIFNSCCTQDKQCLESNLSNIGPEYLIQVLQQAVAELGSSSEIYNTNLCYLFERLYSEGFEALDVYNIFVSILNQGIVIWCFDGIIYAYTVENYLAQLEALSPPE